MCFADVYEKDYVVLKSHKKSTDQLACQANCMHKAKLSHEMLFANLKVFLYITHNRTKKVLIKDCNSEKMPLTHITK